MKVIRYQYLSAIVKHTVMVDGVETIKTEEKVIDLTFKVTV